MLTQTDPEQIGKTTFFPRFRCYVFLMDQGAEPLEDGHKANPPEAITLVLPVLAGHIGIPFSTVVWY